MSASAVSAAERGVYQPRDANGKDIRLQDFCVFKQGRYTYICSMKKDLCNQGMIVARSTDLAKWETLGDAVTTRTAEDKSMVWAPHVVEDRGTFYMFYTGVTTPKPGRWCQRILVAATKDPSKPAAWQRSYDARFVVDGKEQSWFRPSHAGSVWTDSDWADCRDPMVLRHDKTWYLFYSGTDTDGGIAGVATAPSVLGPWTDRGAVMKVAPGTVPESCFVLKASDGTFVMTFNHAGPAREGTKTARAKSLIPVDGKPSFSDIRLIKDTTGPELTGWAHEFIPLGRGDLLCANLTGYFVSLKHAKLRKEAWGWTVVEGAGG